MKTPLPRLAVLGLLVSVGASPLFAADTSGTINTPNNDAYTTAPGTDASPAPKSLGHKKAARKSSRPKTGATLPKDPLSAQGAPNNLGKNTEPPGISGNNIGNDAGKPNMGAGDHTPGMTGNSGM